MSPINSLSGGYQGGSKSSPAPQLSPVPRDYVKEVLSPVEEHYRTNNLTDNDMNFLIACIDNIENNIDYEVDIWISKLAERIVLMIKSNFINKKLTNGNLNTIKEGFQDIVLDVSQDEIISPEPKGKSETSISTLSGYGGGSPRVRSQNIRTEIKKPSKPFPIESLVEQIKRLRADENLSEEDINVLMKELINIK